MTSLIPVTTSKVSSTCHFLTYFLKVAHSLGFAGVKALLVGANTQRQQLKDRIVLEMLANGGPNSLQHLML
jgi:hypothetical protein